MIYQLNDIKDLAIDKTRNIYIDVGTSIGAPHAAKWLHDYPDAMVIGIEPNSQCIEVLAQTRKPADFMYLNIQDSCIMQKDSIVSSYKPENLIIFHCAIDCVPEPQASTFYHTDERNIGCSSLLKPTEHLGLDITSTSEITTVSLEYILDNLGLEDVARINFVKTDTQGKDFDVVRSLGKYLNRINGLKCEYNVKNHYENPNSKEEFQKFMHDNGFRTIAADGFDAYFINSIFLQECNSREDICSIFDELPQGL